MSRRDRAAGGEVDRFGLEGPLEPAPRHVTMADLPPAVAQRFAFDRAAPKRVRSDSLPPDVRGAARAIWDDIIPEIYDEVAGQSRRDLFRRSTIERVLRRIAPRVLAAEGSVIELAVRLPLRFDKSWKHTATASTGAGAVAVAEEVAAYGSMGTAATVSIASIVLGELLETYVTASARTVQYLNVQRSPDPDLIVADMAEALGYTGATGRRANRDVTRQAALWLARSLLERVARRFLRGLVPVAGVISNATLAGIDTRKITGLPLRPLSEDESARLQHGLRWAQSDRPSDPFGVDELGFGSR